MEFPLLHFVPNASHPVTGHYWEEPGSTFFTFLSGIYTYE